MVTFRKMYSDNNITLVLVYEQYFTAGAGLTHFTCSCTARILFFPRKSCFICRLTTGMPSWECSAHEMWSNRTIKKQKNHTNEVREPGNCR